MKQPNDRQSIYTECYGAFEHRAGKWHFVYYPAPPTDGRRCWPIRIPVPAELLGEVLTAKVGA